MATLVYPSRESVVLSLVLLVLVGTEVLISGPLTSQSLIVLASLTLVGVWIVLAGMGIVPLYRLK